MCISVNSTPPLGQVSSLLTYYMMSCGLQVILREELKVTFQQKTCYPRAPEITNLLQAPTISFLIHY